MSIGPDSLSTSSRTWLECQVPRDLTIVNARLRSPLRTNGKTNQIVGNGRNLEIGRFYLRIVALDEGADHHGDLSIFHHVDEPVGDRARRADPPALAIAERGSITMQRGFCSRINVRELIKCSSSAVRFRSAGIHPQQAGLDMRVEIDAH